MTKMAVIKRIDFVGGFLSIVGLTLFLVALQAGGYTHPWASAYVMCCLIIGLALICVWFVWEWKFAKYPMVPFELFKGQRVVGLSFAVAAIAGANFFSLLNFWPLTISSVWDPDPVKIGLRAISVGFATAIGAIVSTPTPQPKTPTKIASLTPSHSSGTPSSPSSPTKSNGSSSPPQPCSQPSAAPSPS